MTPERYRILQNFQDTMTAEEIAEGWHYCLEWDEMLVHPDDEECKNCQMRLDFLRYWHESQTQKT